MAEPAFYPKHDDGGDDYGDNELDEVDHGHCMQQFYMPFKICFYITFNFLTWLV